MTSIVHGLSDLRSTKFYVIYYRVKHIFPCNIILTLCHFIVSASIQMKTLSQWSSKSFLMGIMYCLDATPRDCYGLFQVAGLLLHMQSNQERQSLYSSFNEGRGVFLFNTVRTSSLLTLCLTFTNEYEKLLKIMEDHTNWQNDFLSKHERVTSFYKQSLSL